MLTHLFHTSTWWVLDTTRDVLTANSRASRWVRQWSLDVIGTAVHMLLIFTYNNRLNYLFRFWTFFLIFTNLFDVGTWFILPFRVLAIYICKCLMFDYIFCVNVASSRVRHARYTIIYLLSLIIDYSIL